MTRETFFKAHEVIKEIKRWSDVETRLSCGDGFYVIKFEAFETKTLHETYDLIINDKITIKAYKDYVTLMVRKYETQLQEL